MNPGAELGKKDMPSVWFAARVPADGLRMWRATDLAYTGASSLAIVNSHKYEQQVSNNWMQKLKTVPRGKIVQLRGFIRTENADAVNVCLQCWDLEGKTMLAFASTPVFRGDQDWTETTSRMLLVPENTAEIMVRAALTGEGKAWFDELTVTIVESVDADARRGDASLKKPHSVSGTQGKVEDTRQRVAVQLDPGAIVQPAEDLTEVAPGQILKEIPIVKDCMILSYLPLWKHGNVDNLAVADNDGGVRTLLDWDSNLPDDALEKNRKFFVALYSRKTTVQPTSDSVKVYGVKDDWPEKTSWETQPGITTKPISYVEFSSGEGWKLFDVTKLVREQAVRRNGHGVMLRFDAEDKSTKEWSGYSFVSREGIGEWQGRCPRLLVVDTSEGNQIDKP
jgi:hypothetical protein